MPVTEEQFDAVCERLDDIAADIKHIVDGNGRPQGVRALLDDVYGPRGRERPGLFERVVLLEKEVRALAEQRKETRWLQRGIAIGVGVVAFDSVLGLDLGSVVRLWFGGAS